MNKEQIQLALAAGLALTDPGTDLLDVFRKHAGGIIMLRQLLIGIGSGQVTLATATQEEPPKDPKENPDTTPDAEENPGKTPEEMLAESQVAAENK